MAKIQINEFKGILPKIANDKIPNEHGQTAQDLKLATGELQAYKKSTTDTALPLTSYKSFFQYIDGTNANWAYYAGLVYHARSPVADDTFNRTYFLGDSGLPAQGTITFTDGMTDGETVTIGSQTIEFDIAEDGVGGGNSSAGSSATSTKEQAAAALAAVTPGAAVTFTDNEDGTVTVEATSNGTAGNAIVLTEAGAHITVDGSGTLGATQSGQDDGEYRAFSNDIDSSPWDFSVDYYTPGAPAGSAPTVAAAVGGGSDYYAYFYTYISRYSEEGPGSDVGEITDYTSGRRTVDNIDYPSAADDHLITAVGTNYPKVGVYRTASTGDGEAAFLQVCEAFWFDSTYTYTAGDYVFYDDGGGYDLYECTVGGVGTWAGGTHTFVQGEAVTDANLGSTTFQYLGRRCPDDLTNLRAHPNGFFVASKGNTLYFSEPYGPWAWPEDYEIPLPAQVVGVGIYGSTIVVATDANIYTFAGSHPTSLYKQKGPFQPCLSQRATIETDLGVMFPSLEGFQMVDANGEPRNVTADFFKPDDWADYELETMHAAWYNKAYYGFYKSADYEGHLIIDFLNSSITTGMDYHYAAYVSEANGIFRTIYTSNVAAPSVLNIAKWDADATAYRNYTFKTKRYILETPANFKVAQIILDLDWYSAVETAAGGDLTTLNATEWADTDWGNMLGGPMNDFVANDQDMNGDNLFNLASLGLQNYVDFRVYVDGDLKWSREVTSNDMFKLPRGFKHKKWEFEVVGMIPIKRITIATSTEEITGG